MPLKKGFSKKSVRQNFKTLKREGYSRKQSIAIVLNIARKAKRNRRKR